MDGKNELLIPLLIILTKKLKELKDQPGYVEYLSKILISEGMFSKEELYEMSERYVKFRIRVSELTSSHHIHKALALALNEYPEFKFKLHELNES